MADTKLADMTVEEFFEHGFDSDGDDDESDEDLAENENEGVGNGDEVEENGEAVEENRDEVEENREAVEDNMLVENEEEQVESVEVQKKERKMKSLSKHKDELESLKEKDPEFYKFLQENDEELLAFSASDDDDDDDDDSDVDGGDKKVKKSLDEDADEDGDSADEFSGDEEEGNDEDEDVCDEEDLSDGKEDEDDEVDDSRKKPGKDVSEKMLKRWNDGLEDNSLKSLKFVFHAFHAAVGSMSPEEEEEEKEKKEKRRGKYLVKSPSTYNNLMKMCLKYSPRVLDKNLTSAKQKKFTSTHLPSSCKLWSNIKSPLKYYLYDILKLLRVHTDVSVLTILLRHCQALSAYYACFPKISKMLLKRLTRMWCSGEEHVRVIAFLCIRSLSLLLPNLFEYVLKKLYLGFVRNSKFVTVMTKPLITFMKNSLVEMFSHNEAATYKHGFLYIRQLAITLRNAITIKKKDSQQTVYNWQYISCLELWSQVVSDLNGEVLKPLIYPVVQINLGVIKLIPSAKYYPLRFHCIQSLNYISKKTGAYIPTASYILEAIESKAFLQRATSSEKVPDFTGVLKVSQSQLHSKAFKDCTVDIAVESLLEHYAIFSHSIAFPELIFPVCRRIKRFMKNNRVLKLGQDMKMVVEKLQSHADTIQKARDQVNFSPKDLEQVNKWEDERRSASNSLMEFLETWKRMKSLTDSSQTLTNHTDTNQNKSSGDEAKTKNDKSKAGEKRTNDKGTNLSATKKKKKRNIVKEKRQFDGDNDIVEDYKLSEDED